jgi:hypothetical protein
VLNVFVLSSDAVEVPSGACAIRQLPGSARATDIPATP